jgi:two-component system response regulator (stage 0 sporulation protein F)
MDAVKPVLIIDDVEGLSFYLAKTFERAGLKAYEARGGAQGIQIFKEVAPGIVMLDMHLPDMNGLDVLKELKRINPQARIMIMSGDVELVTQLRQSNPAIELVDKPIDMRDLFARLGLSRK